MSQRKEMKPIRTLLADAKKAEIRKLTAAIERTELGFDTLGLRLHVISDFGSTAKSDQDKELVNNLYDDLAQEAQALTLQRINLQATLRQLETPAAENKLELVPNAAVIDSLEEYQEKKSAPSLKELEQTWDELNSAWLAMKSSARPR